MITVARSSPRLPTQGDPAQQQQNAFMGLMESKAKKWSNMPGSQIRGFSKSKTVDFLEGIKDPIKRGIVAVLLENAHNWLTQEIDEMTRTVHVGSFEKFIFPLIRATYANLIAQELVTVQPLTAPTGTVFYMDILYGTGKGRIARGGKMFDVRHGPSTDHHFTDEIIEQEVRGVGNAVTTHFTGNLDQAVAGAPIRPTTVKFTDGSASIVDDGNGVLSGDGTGMINYASGAYVLDFTAAPASGETITADYEIDSEASAVPEIELVMSSSPVTARSQRLKYLVSVESQQNFQAYFGANADTELTAYMANELQKEINYRIVRHLEQIAAATATPVTWDHQPPANVPWIWHKESFFDVLIRCGNAIFKQTQRRGGNRLVAGINVCNVLETLQKFKAASGQDSGDAGMRKIGEIGDFICFKDPTMGDNNWLVAYKGSNWLDTGYIHSPFLGVYVTPVFTLDDMVSRKAMMQRSGQKVINPFFYAKGTMIHPGVFENAAPAA